MVPLIRVRKASRKSHWGSIAIRRGWTPLFLRIVRLLRCFKPWEGEGGPQALKHAGRCEPGDLPANEGNRARPGKVFPAACTEVVMAVLRRKGGIAPGMNGSSGALPACRRVGLFSGAIARAA